jgi:hypothetical protein
MSAWHVVVTKRVVSSPQLQHRGRPPGPSRSCAPTSCLTNGLHGRCSPQGAVRAGQPPLVHCSSAKPVPDLLGYPTGRGSPFVLDVLGHAGPPPPPLLSDRSVVSWLPPHAGSRVHPDRVVGVDQGYLAGLIWSSTSCQRSRGTHVSADFRQPPRDRGPPGASEGLGAARRTGCWGGTVRWVDFTCAPCRRDDFIDCRKLRVTGLAFDSGYAEAMLVPATPSPPFPAG